MTAFHCDKLCSGLCCAPLRSALDLKVIDVDTFRRLREGGSLISLDREYEALQAVSDPAKIAELLAMAGKARGVAIERPRVCGHPYPTPMVSIVDEQGPCAFGFVMKRARTLLAAIMLTPPDESSREAVEALFRGEA